MFLVKRVGLIEVTPFEEKGIGLVTKPVAKFMANPVASQVARHGGYDKHPDKCKHG